MVLFDWELGNWLCGKIRLIKKYIICKGQKLYIDLYYYIDVKNSICYSDLVWRMQLIIIWGKKIVLCVWIFNLNCLLFEFFILNMSQIILVHKAEIFKANFLSTKSAFEFVFSRCEFTKVIWSQKAGLKCSY